MNFEAYAFYGVPALPLIIGLINLLKYTGLPSKFAPLGSLCLGVLVGIGIAVSQSDPILQGIVTGVALGLISCGMYDVAKKAL